MFYELITKLIDSSFLVDHKIERIRVMPWTRITVYTGGDTLYLGVSSLYPCMYVTLALY